jgi:hypothetical protein
VTAAADVFSEASELGRRAQDIAEQIAAGDLLWLDQEVGTVGWRCHLKLQDFLIADTAILGGAIQQALLYHYGRLFHQRYGRGVAIR